MGAYYSHHICARLSKLLRLGRDSRGGHSEGAQSYLAESPHHHPVGFEYKKLTLKSQFRNLGCFKEAAIEDNSICECIHAAAVSARAVSSNCQEVLCSGC